MRQAWQDIVNALPELPFQGSATAEQLELAARAIGGPVPEPLAAFYALSAGVQPHLALADAEVLPGLVFLPIEAAARRYAALAAAEGEAQRKGFWPLFSGFGSEISMDLADGRVYETYLLEDTERAHRSIEEFVAYVAAAYTTGAVGVHPDSGRRAWRFPQRDALWNEGETWD